MIVLGQENKDNALGADLAESGSWDWKFLSFAIVSVLQHFPPIYLLITSVWIYFSMYVSLLLFRSLSTSSTNFQIKLFTSLQYIHHPTVCFRG